MRVFVRVAETASFTRAAEQLRLPKPTVTIAVQQLEARLRVRLLNRTTRKVALTEEGATYRARCARILADIEESDALFARRGGRLHGTVRLDVPERLTALYLMPALPEFVRDHPDLELIVSATDRFTDLVQNGIDCVVRVGAPGRSSMTVRNLGRVEQANVASRAYVERTGLPRTLADLKAHLTVGFHSGDGAHDYDFEHVEGGVTRHVPMRGHVAVSSSSAYLAACVAGLGIIQAPRHALEPELRSGELVEFLPDYRPAPLPISILHAQGRRLAPRVRAVVDWLTATLGPRYRRTL
jgi:DNA-binding transcriptional LysR family regulator